MCLYGGNKVEIFKTPKRTVRQNALFNLNKKI